LAPSRVLLATSSRTPSVSRVSPFSHSVFPTLMFLSYVLPTLCSALTLFATQTKPDANTGKTVASSTGGPTRPPPPLRNVSPASASNTPTTQSSVQTGNTTPSTLASPAEKTAPTRAVSLSLSPPGRRVSSPIRRGRSSRTMSSLDWGSTRLSSFSSLRSRRGGRGRRRGERRLGGSGRIRIRCASLSLLHSFSY
jgi:hypothetical protein